MFRPRIGPGSVRHDDPLEGGAANRYFPHTDVVARDLWREQFGLTSVKLFGQFVEFGDEIIGEFDHQVA